RLMRRELEREKYGGPGRRVVEHPLVLVALFALTVGGLAWTFLPARQDRLFPRGAAPIGAGDPRDSGRAPGRQLSAPGGEIPGHPLQGGGGGLPRALPGAAGRPQGRGGRPPGRPAGRGTMVLPARPAPAPAGRRGGRAARLAGAHRRLRRRARRGPV